MFTSVRWWSPGLPLLSGGPPRLSLLAGGPPGLLVLACGPQVYLC